MKIKDERWKSIKGYEGLYEVSDWGRVRSLNYGKVKVLSPIDNGKGYLRVMLCKDGKKKQFLVHRLVWVSFRGTIPKGMQINHLNEDKSDNRLSNLEMVTAKQNVNHGTRNERVAKALSKQLDLIEADYPYTKLTFENSLKAGEFFNYKREDQVGCFISKARKRNENYINIRGTRYLFAQEA